jgi:hypothetical protein
MLASLGWALLSWGTAASLIGAGDLWGEQPKRFWEDLALGSGFYFHGQFPVARGAFAKHQDETGVHYVEYRGRLTRAARESSPAPWEFWRTVPDDAFRKKNPRNSPPLFPRFDDPGRPLLLGVGYLALGGVAPCLLFWMGALLAAPVFAWVGLELALAGRPWGGAAFLAILGTSAFVVDVLRLAYAAIGFYLLGALVLSALAVYGALGRDSSASGFWLRMLAGGTLFGACALARSSNVLLGPGIALAVLLAARRVFGPGPRGLGAALAGLVVFAAPCLAERAGVARIVSRTFRDHGGRTPVPQIHPIWWNLWAGLGDFDRSKSHVWQDEVVSRVVMQAGGTPIGTSFLDPGNEAILRRLFLADIGGDPVWYATILAKRAAATATQWKLWPWGPSSGRSMRPRDHANEGMIDAYYGLGAPVDVAAVGPWRFELPVPLLMLPLAVLLGLATFGRDAGRRAELRAVACLAVGTLVLPVLVTTAGGLETQVFALTYFLSAGLLCGTRGG